MAIAKFFHQAVNFIEQEEVILSEDEARHASQVRRLQRGDAVMLLNGHGITGEGRFVELSKRKAIVCIEQVKRYDPPKRRICIASAIPKGDRQKVMIDMLTQAGVSSFIPLDCEFSVVKANDKTLEKWRRIVLEACKQSGNPFAMVVNPSLSIEELVVSEVWRQSQVFIADQDAPNIQTIQQSDCLALIGPEGGFSADELKKFTDSGVEKMKLAANILRTETAAIAAAVRLTNG